MVNDIQCKNTQNELSTVWKCLISEMVMRSYNIKSLHELTAKHRNRKAVIALSHAFCPSFRNIFLKEKNLHQEYSISHWHFKKFFPIKLILEIWDKFHKIKKKKFMKLVCSPDKASFSEAALSHWNTGWKIHSRGTYLGYKQSCLFLLLFCR